MADLSKHVSMAESFAGRADDAGRMARSFLAAMQRLAEVEAELADRNDAALEEGRSTFWRLRAEAAEARLAEVMALAADEHIHGPDLDDDEDCFGCVLTRAAAGDDRATPAEFDPDCPRCDQDEHTCPGCGADTNHARPVCARCSGLDRATPAADVQYILERDADLLRRLGEGPT